MSRRRVEGGSIHAPSFPKKKRKDKKEPKSGFIPQVDEALNEVLEKYSDLEIDEELAGKIEEEVCKILTYFWRTKGVVLKLPEEPKVSVKPGYDLGQIQIICENDSAAALLEESG